MHRMRWNVLAVSISAVALAPLIASAAWIGPTAAPPNGNIAAPINVGTTNQVKNGGLGVNSLAVYGNAILSGVGRYFNFGSTAGTGGYGIRDNAGLLEFKNSGGSWESIQATVFNLVGGASSWAVSGNNMYNANTGNVGIGTANPSERLYVKGGNTLIESVAPLLRFYDPSKPAGSRRGQIQLSGQQISIGPTTDEPAWINPEGSNKGVLNVYGTGAAVDGNFFASNGYDSADQSAAGCGGLFGGGYTFRVCGTMGASAMYDFNDPSFYVDPNYVSNLNTVYTGDVYSTSGGNWLSSYSDARLKTAIKDLPEDSGLRSIMKLRPVTFHWKDIKRNEQEGEQLGFIAQEVEKIFPDLVRPGQGTTTIETDQGTEHIGNPKNMYAAYLTVPLVKAVQEQQAEIESQSAEIESLMSDNAALKRSIEELRSAIGSGR